MFIRPIAKAFSSEVDNGSREENAIEQIHRAPIRCNRIGKRSKALSLAAAVLALSSLAAWADPRCARFGRVDYTASRTMDGRSSKVFVSGRNFREERPAPDGTTEVYLISGGVQTIFNPTGKFGVRLPSRRPPPIPADARRTRVEGDTIIAELRDADGTFKEIDRVTCRSDGVLLSARSLGAGREGPRTIAISQSNIVTGRLDPALFRVPADVKIGPPPRRPQ
jgi:hypothetical protein